MADAINSMSDDELESEFKKLLSGKNPPKAGAHRPANVQPTQSFAPVDTTQGMSQGELALAGAGLPVSNLVEGVKDKARLLSLVNTPDDNPERVRLISDLNARRAEKKRIDAQLRENPAANFGELGSNVAIGAAAPMRVPAQMATFGGLEAMSQGPEGVRGIGGELAGSGIRGGLAAAGTWAGGQIPKWFGRAANAARGEYTPIGAEAMRTSDAARSLGMPSPSIGELAPSSTLGMLHQSAFNRGKKVEEAGSALASALEGSTGRPAGAYQEGLKRAVGKKFDEGSAAYRAVDDFAQANNLSGVRPLTTYDTLRQVDPKVIGLLQKFKPDSISWARDLGLPAPGQTMQTMLQQGIPLSKLHEVRQATNQAWKVVAKAAQRDPASAELVTMEQQLNKLRGALDTDATQWATQNAGNADAMKLYTAAKDKWQNDIVPTVVNNSIARRLNDPFKPYETGADLLGASTSSRGRELVDRLLPTGTPQLSDMAQVLQSLPEPARYVISGRVPTREAGIGSIPSGLVGNLAADMGGLSRAELMKRLYFSRNPGEGASGLGEDIMSRLGYGIAQQPSGEIEEGLRGLAAVR